MNRDLTVGRPSSVLLAFCLPLFGSVIFQQLYNIADSLIAGKFIGESALVAVGNSYEVTLIFIAFAFGCNIGCSVVVSQLFGAKRLEEMKTAISTAMIASGVLCLLLMGFGLAGCEGLLRLIRTPEDILPDSRLYLDIYVLGLPFMFFYNISNGVFSALGDSRTPFLFLSVSSTANILVDVLFVTVLHMGVSGVAWATFLCQGVSCVLSLCVLLRRLIAIRTEKRAPLFSLRLLRRMTVIAVPSMLQQSFISVGNIVIQSVINGFGSAAIAGYAAAVKLNNLVITSLTTLANGISNYTAQNIGAGKTERVQQGFSVGLRLVWALSLPFFLAYFFLGRVFLNLFMDAPSAAAVHTGVTFLRILSPFYFVISAKLVADGILRGAGRMSRFMIATLTDLVLRVVLAIFLSRTALGETGIWCAWPIGWSIASLISLLFYRSMHRSAAGANAGAAQ